MERKLRDDYCGEAIGVFYKGVLGKLGFKQSNVTVRCVSRRGLTRFEKVAVMDKIRAISW